MWYCYSLSIFNGITYNNIEQFFTNIVYMKSIQDFSLHEVLRKKLQSSKNMKFTKNQWALDGCIITKSRQLRKKSIKYTSTKISAVI